MILTESAGVARVLIKEEDREWSTRLGGAIRQHIDRDVLIEGETERETLSTSDGGLQFVSELRTPLADGAITLTSDLTVFQALYYSESDALEGLPGADDWKSPDVNWENNFSAASLTISSSISTCRCYTTRRSTTASGSRRRSRSGSRSSYSNSERYSLEVS